MFFKQRKNLQEDQARLQKEREYLDRRKDNLHKEYVELEQRIGLQEQKEALFAEKEANAMECWADLRKQEHEYHHEEARKKVKLAKLEAQIEAGEKIETMNRNHIAELERLTREFSEERAKMQREHAASQQLLVKEFEASRNHMLNELSKALSTPKAEQVVNVKQ